MTKVLSKSGQIGLLKEENLDAAAVQYAKLTDAEAKERVKKVKSRIQELASADLSTDINALVELRELKSTLAWFKANKLRSRFFRWDQVPASMRSANRHPKAGKFKTMSNDTRPKKRTKDRQKRKTLPFIKSIFSRRES